MRTAAIVAALCLAPSAFAAVAFVQNPTAGTAIATPCTTGSATWTTGNTIVVTVAIKSTSSTPSVTGISQSAGSNTYTQAAHLGTTTFESVWTSVNITGGTFTISAALSGSSITEVVCTAAEYSGVSSVGSHNTAAAKSISVTNTVATTSWCSTGFALSGANTSTAGNQHLRATALAGTTLDGAQVDTNSGAGLDSSCTTTVTNADTTAEAVTVELRPPGIYFVAAGAVVTVQPTEPSYKQNPASGTAQVSATCSTASATWTTGNAIVVVVTEDVTHAVSSISQSSGSNTYTLQASANDASSIGRVEIWTATSITGGTFQVTANFSGVNQDIVCNAAEYQNVGGIGASTTGTGAAANPTITLTTNDWNSVCVAGFSGEGTNTFTAGTGNLRGSAVVTNAQPAGGEGGAENDISEATSTSCTQGVTNADTVWVNAAVELEATNTGATPSCVLGSAAHTSGNTLVAFLASNSGASTPTISDSSSTWALTANGGNGAGTYSLFVWTAKAADSSAHIITISGLDANSTALCAWAEYSQVNCVESATLLTLPNTANPSQTISWATNLDWCVGLGSGLGTNHTITAATGDLRVSGEAVSFGSSTLGYLADAVASAGTCTVGVTSADVHWQLAAFPLSVLACVAPNPRTLTLTGAGSQRDPLPSERPSRFVALLRDAAWILPSLF